MKKSINVLRTLLVAAIAPLLVTASAQAANLSDKDKHFLAGYEKIHTALAADDLSGAKAAANDLSSEGAELSKSSSLKEARTAFERLSAKAKQLAAEQPGYYVFHCPMLKKDWVQTSTTVANPYAGQDMVSCGEIQK